MTDEIKNKVLAEFSLTIEDIDFEITDDMTEETFREAVDKFMETKENSTDKPQVTFSATYRQKREALDNALDPIIVKDGDGNVSREEIMSARKGNRHGPSLYFQADANKDGQLDQAEYSKLLQLRKERQAQIEAATPDFATLDTNKDGKISKEEMRAGMKAMHEKLRVAE